MQYKIETLQDIYNCVNMQNVDNFLVDFSAYLKSTLLIEEMLSKEAVNRKEFIWINDGKHNADIIISDKNTDISNENID